MSVSCFLSSDRIFDSQLEEPTAEADDHRDVEEAILQPTDTAIQKLHLTLQLCPHQGEIHKSEVFFREAECHTIKGNAVSCGVQRALERETAFDKYDWMGAERQT